MATDARPSPRPQHRGARRLWDISPPVHAGSPVFPGDTPFRLDWVARIGPGCPVNVGAVSCSPHVGAHADAPLHYDPEGEGAGTLALAPYLGPCRLVHLMHGGAGTPRLVDREDLAPKLPGTPPRVLVRLYERMPQQYFDNALPAFTAAAVEHLADLGVLLLGTDSASLDPAESKDLPAHQALRRRGLRVLENLLLDDVPEGDYELIALPLRWPGADATPVRAVLRELE
jgi:arylformamidase